MLLPGRGSRGRGGGRWSRGGGERLYRGRGGGGSPSCWLERMQTGVVEFTKGSDSESNMFPNCISLYAFVQVCWKSSNLLPRTSGGRDRLPPLPPVDHATCARPPLNYHAYQIRQKAGKKESYVRTYVGSLFFTVPVYGTLGTPSFHAPLFLGRK